MNYKSPQFDKDERAKLKQLMVAETDALIETLTQSKNALMQASNDDEIKDITIAIAKAEQYFQQAMNIYRGFDNPVMWCFTGKDFWELETLCRNMIWWRMRNVLGINTSVFKKIVEYLDIDNSGEIWLRTWANKWSFAQ